MTDYLSRQPYIDLLKSIIVNQKDNQSGYSFAIDGEWGCGKTWVLNKLENELVKENKYLIFHYNAWENDFYDEPLVAILSVMIERLEKICKGEETINNLNAKLSSTTLAIFKNLAISFVNTTVKNKIGIDFRDVIEDFKKVKDIKSELRELENQIDNSLPLKRGISEIRNQLRELAKDVTILFIVDELDRCLPEYAIKVLERLHHICNEMPIIQILAIDKTNFADSICKVFGKDFSENQNKPAWREKFAENYLQKFVDVIIALPNGKPENRLEILNGLEKSYSSYIRKNNGGQEFIRLDDEFLATFISALMNNVEMRLQEKIFKQVELCHKLTIDSGAKIDKENMTYAILIYEIISCIDRYVFHHADTSKLHYSNAVYTLEFFSDGFVSNNRPFEIENKQLNDNLKNFFSCSEQKDNNTYRSPLETFKIYDTKSYVMAFFTKKPDFSYVIFESHVWDWIQEDKIFLQKYDEIMNTITIK